MNLNEWLIDSESTVSVVKHQSKNPEKSLDETVKDLNKSWLRLSALNKILKPISLVMAMTVATSAIAMPITEYTESMKEPAVKTEEVVKNYKSKDLRNAFEEISEDYRQFNDIAGTEALVVVNAKDPNMIDMALGLENDMLPNILRSLSENTLSDVFSHYAQIKKKPGMSISLGNEEKGNICLVVINLDGEVENSKLYKHDFSSASSAHSLYTHELAHCYFNENNVQEVSGFKHEDIKVWQNESAADLTDAFLNASRTGNLDYVNYELMKLRALSRHEKDVHATQFYIKEFKNEINPLLLDKDMTLQDAFNKAMDFLERTNEKYGLKDIATETFRQQEQNYIISQKMSEDSKGNENEIVDLDKKFMEDVSVYLNYINYKSFEDREVHVNSFLNMVEGYAKIKDDQSLFEIVENERTMFNINKELNLPIIAEKLGVSITDSTEARERHALNDANTKDSLFEYLAPKEKKEWEDKNTKKLSENLRL